MRRMAIGLVLTAVVALTGCSSVWDGPAPDPILETSVDPQSQPGFLNDRPTADDVLPAESATGIDPASVRYQGRWDRRDFYLGLDGGRLVSLISVPVDASRIGGTGSGSGNSVLTASREGEERIGLAYLPQGTASPPEGWRALSGWIVVRK